MADTEISPFLNKLGYMLLAEVDSLHEVENELWSLHWLLTRLTSFPMDVSKDYYLMEYRKKAMEVITILHEAEDVIDSYLDTTKCRNYSTSAHKVLKFTSQIKGMMDKLKGLHVWFHDHFTKSCSTCGTSSSSKRSLANEVGDHMVVVLEDEVQKMIDLLKDEEDPQREVIPVVGPGGIGKTTLVRKVYNHPTIVEHFPCRSWIYVSSDYKLEELLQDIIDQIKPTSTAPAGSGSGSAAAARNIVDEEMMSLKDLAIQTYELLKTTSTRYLVVFDDVCKTQFWEDIHMIFPNNKLNSGGGSRIIFTTRHDEVALYARPSRPPFNLRPLTKEESWKLFSNRVSLVEDHHHHHPLQEWVDACGGVPHILVALAEEYINNHSPDHQLSMTDKIPTPPPPRRIQELIYSDLPHHLKTCLSYFDISEEGSYSFFDFKGLIVAEGLVKPPPLSASASASAIATVVELEDIAEEYLNELIHRNLIEVKSRSFDGRIKEISLLDLCRSEAAVAATKMKFQQTDLGNGFYECIFSSDDDPPPPTLIKEERSKRMKKKFIQKKRKERSLFNWNLYQPTKTWDGITGPFLQRIFNNLVSLRVLDLSIGFYNIPRQIDLIHLRYLRLENISGDSFSRRNYVTSAISGLWNLQFLKIKGYFTELEISEMKQLRHLSSDVYVELSLEIEERSDSNVVFKNLQTLKGCPIDYILGEDILSKMTNLVTLHLLGVVRCEKLLVRGFPLLKRLQELKLTGQAFRSSDTSPYKLELFPPNITHLTLQRTFVQRRYVMQALRKLKNLRVLKLKFGSISEKEDLDLGRDGDGAGEGDGDGDGDGFLQLKFLKLKDLFQSGQLRKWHMSKGVMPSLEKVAIINCKNLEGLPSAALEVIPTLQELEVDASNDQVLTDARLIEERMGKDRLKLSLIQ
ncbi:probable disease resistance RPP8-like protein 2 isoform X1 [Macadamia integrifolia]|uniref:probable disease resistance RPP8-like protein 2 isoform X1 n=1 Tax=Macadamia integrifolia TaxID=60698 RepID=UPI001C4E6876|nr:probable disease resistance RPP8-like protein 2 isoform X1 [Macadamia integrifolia]XP_042495813.1 probable disease resistance RPP8-like protein 2 isoform X1 [Macadamia integrifolia]